MWTLTPKHPRVEGSLRAGNDVVLKPHEVARVSCPQASFIRGADMRSLPCLVVCLGSLLGV